MHRPNRVAPPESVRREPGHRKRLAGVESPAGEVDRAGCRANAEYCTATESTVRSRRFVDRCFAIEWRRSQGHASQHVPTRDPEVLACAERRPAGRFRHQTGCGGNQAQTIGGEAVAGARGFRHRTWAYESHSQGRRRSAGGAGCAERAFQPNSDKVNRSYQSRELPDRFSQQLRRFEFDEPSQRNSWCGSPA